MDVPAMHPVLANAAHSSVIIDGQPVHFVEYGGTQTGPTYVLVHGLGGSHLNWDLLAPELIEHGYVYSIDLRGFGRTEPNGLDANVRSNAGLLEDFLRIVVGAQYEDVVLVGNSMGGMISALLAESCPDLVDGLVLLDPALPLPGPGLGRLGALWTGTAFWALERLLGATGALTAERKTRLMMKTCGVDPTGLPDWFIDRSVSLLNERTDTEAMDAAFFQAARSCTSLMVHPGTYRRAMDSITAPVLLIHGDRDRIVNVRAARDVARRNPDWTYVELRGVGHCPMVEVPQRTFDEITAWALLEGLA